jgi:outer membrane receptor protein involved in Fe transport
VGSTTPGAGTAINLRGLGSDATLTLVNGRRIAPSAAGAFVDVSQIPMAGVDRVEILPDGASALYGSDAIGGVVNFVMRKHYEGAETSARYGAGDGFEEYSASQVFGKDWGSGSLTLAYEHFYRGNLSGRDRDYYRSDLTRFGGNNFLPQDLNDRQAFQAVPGTIVADGVTYAIPRNQNGQGLTFAALGPAGSYNQQDPQLFQDILPEQKRDSFVGLAAPGAVPQSTGVLRCLLLPPVVCAAHPAGDQQPDDRAGQSVLHRGHPGRRGRISGALRLFRRP